MKRLIACLFIIGIVIVGVTYREIIIGWSVRIEQTVIQTPEGKSPPPLQPISQQPSVPVPTVAPTPLLPSVPPLPIEKAVKPLDLWCRVECKPDRAMRKEAGDGFNTATSNLVLRINALGIVNGRTILRAMVTGSEDEQGVRFEIPGGVYFTDSQGKRYDLLSVNMKTESGEHYRLVKQHEVFRFEMVFSELEFRSSYLDFHFPDFTYMRVWVQWKNPQAQERRG